MSDSQSKNATASGDGFVVVELYLFDTCTHRCAYCWLAEQGLVLDAEQLKPFRDQAFIDRLSEFFNSRTSARRHWLVTLTGGEPLLMPNLRTFCRALFDHDNRVAFYTALLLDQSHAGFRFLLEHGAPQVDYVMASLHPEAEADEALFFRKVALLKDAGHKVFVRFVGHPARLHRLPSIRAQCEALDVAFYPTTLFSTRYPGAYTDAERHVLADEFSTMSQHVQLAGGVDTTTVRCRAGSKVIAINLKTGDITPCITVSRPLLGNILEDSLDLYSDAIGCPEAGITCNCDVHFQQNIVLGAEDGEPFESLKQGYTNRRMAGDSVATVLRDRGVSFYQGSAMGIGHVQQDQILFFSKEEVLKRWREFRANRRA